MRKGITVVRAHAALSVCLLLVALGLAGGGVYAVLAGDLEPAGPGEPVSTLNPDEVTAAGTAPAQAAQQWFRDTAAANGIPLPETARAEALAAPSAASSGTTAAVAVVTADTPSVMPVHLPVSAMNVQRLQQAFPGMHISAEMEARTQAQLDALANVTLGITTAAVNQGTERSAGPAAKSRAVQKSNEGEEEPNFDDLDLAGDFTAVMAIFYPDAESQSIDMNRLTLNADGDMWFGGGNGIPDRAELMIVQHVLQTDSIEFLTDGGVSHYAAVHRWQAILNSFHPVAGALGLGLTEGQQDSLKNVIAGYCMLGDPGSVVTGVLLGILGGWGVVNGEALTGLIGPMPWPLSAGGNFSGSEAYCNSAMATIAAIIAPAATPPDATFAEVFDTYRDLLDANTGSQEALLNAVQSKIPGFHFHSVTIETAGQFFLPNVGRFDSPAGCPVTMIAEPDSPWHFDHWEVTSASGARFMTATQTLTIDNLSDDITVRVCGHGVSTAAIDFAFTDRRLEQAVRVAADKLTGDLLWADVDGLHLLEARGQGITSLDGLQYLSGLLFLDLRDNRIADLTPLAALAGLKALCLGHNNLVSVSGQSHPLAPLAGLNQLELLDLGWTFAGFDQMEWASHGQGNRLTNVAPLDSLASLKDLDLCGNALVSLDGLSNKPALQVLLLDDNPMLLAPENTAYSTQNGTTVASLNSLIVLSAANTGLTNGALTALLRDPENAGACSLTALLGIALSGNHDITTLASLAPYSDLQILKCGDNPNLVNIDALGGKNALTVVYLAGTSVTDLTPLTGTSFQGGTLGLRNNTPLNNLAEMSVCNEVDSIEAHGNTVARDFACGAESLITLAVSPADAGTVLPFVGGYPVYLGGHGGAAVVQAVETNPDYIFSHWDGPVTDADNPTTPVYIDQSITLTAMFVKHADHTLTMLPPDGAGTVTPVPGCWACRNGEQRAMTATPALGWVFAQWVDGQGVTYPNGDRDTLTMTMSTSRVVKAVFLPADVRLYVSVDGNGKVTQDHDSGYYSSGDTVTLTAVPDTYSCLTGWQYTDLDTWAPNALNVSCVHLTPDRCPNGSRAVHVVFNQCDKTDFNLEVDGFGITTPEEGTYHCTPGTMLALSANPYPGWRFDHWEETGLPDQPRDPYSVTITQQTAPRTITAKFVKHNVVDDFQAWLIAVYPGTQPDIGSYHLGQDFLPDQHDQSARGHDMPDLMRFVMLDACLRNPAHPLHAEVTEAFWGNVVKWYAYAAQFTDNDMNTNAGPYVFPSAAELHSFAAYSTFRSVNDAPPWTTMDTLAVSIFKIAHHLSLYSTDSQGLYPTFVGGLGLNGDFDGDGFSNIDEWLHKEWIYAGVAAGIPNWTPGTGALEPNTFIGLVLDLLDDGLLSPAIVPQFTSSMPAGAPPTVNVTVAKEGHGNTSLPPGNYSLPRYRLDDWPPGSTQTECADCQSTSLTVHAWNTADWFFRFWYYETGPGTATAQFGGGVCPAGTGENRLTIEPSNGPEGNSILAQFGSPTQ